MIQTGEIKAAAIARQEDLVLPRHYLQPTPSALPEESEKPRASSMHNFYLNSTARAH